MKKLMSLKAYRGKDRIFSSVPGAPGISRLYVWDKNKMEYLTPKRAKRYCARRYSYIDGEKKRRFEFFSTLDEAREWQLTGKPASFSKEVAATEGPNSSPSFKEVIEKWQKDSWPLLKENTTIQYSKCLKFFGSLLHRPIETIRPSDIDDLIAGWKQKRGGYRKVRTSFAKEFETLTIIFRWYQGNFDDAAIVMPFKDRHYKQIILKYATKVARKHMTEEECDRFLAELLKEGLMFYVLGFTQFKQMLRISEACAMKWQHLDTEENSYALCEHAVWPRVGGKPPYIALGTKNIKAGEVYMINLFQEVVNQIGRIKKYPGCDLIFHNNGKLLTYRQIQYRFDKAFKVAGLPFSATHVLRHTGSTVFYNASGGDLLALQQMGTWSNSRMPQHYAKVVSSRAKDAIKKLESKPALKLVKED
jgi:integrase